jgi:hypothetical protein
MTRATPPGFIEVTVFDGTTKRRRLLAVSQIRLVGEDANETKFVMVDGTIGSCVELFEDIRLALFNACDKHK